MKHHDPRTGGLTTCNRVISARENKLAKPASETVTVSPDPMEWDGKDASGKTLPDGNYTFELKNYQNGKLIGTDPAESYSWVVEAQTGSSGPVLLLDDSGAQVDASKVTALRAAR